MKVPRAMDESKHHNLLLTNLMHEAIALQEGLPGIRIAGFRDNSTAAGKAPKRACRVFGFFDQRCGVSWRILSDETCSRF